MSDKSSDYRNIGIVTCYTSNIEELVSPLSHNKEEYCKRWKYHYLLDIIYETEEEWTRRNKIRLGFSKIIYLLRLMDIYPDIETFVWMDNDAFIMNQTIPLEDFIHPEADLTIGEDWNGINVGVFFISNNSRTKKFLNDVLAHIPSSTDPRPYWWVVSEQNAISDLIDKSDIIVHLHHHSLFNGYVKEYGINTSNDWQVFGLGPRNPDWRPRYFQPGDFAIHFAGVPNGAKPELIKKYLGEVIR